MIALPISTALGLLAAHLTITNVGSNLFGYVTLIATVTTLIPFADLGVGAAVTNAMASAGEDPAERASLDRVTLTSVRTLIVSSALVVVSTLVIAVTVGWPRLLGVHGPNMGSANLATVVVLVLFALTLPLGVGQRLLIGSHRNHVAVFVGTAGAPVALVGTWLAAVSGVSPPWFAVPPVVAALAAAFLSSVAAKRLTGVDVFLQMGRILPVKSWPGGQIRKAALPMFIIMVGLPLALQSDRVILSHRSSSGQLSAYSLGAQLTVPFWAVLTTAGMSLWPIFAADRAKSSGATQGRGRWLALVALFGGTALVAGAALVALTPPVARLVSSGKIDVPRSLMLAMAVLLVVQALHLPSGMFLTDERGLKFQAVCVGAMLVVNLASSWWWAGRYGAIGPILGSILGIGFAQLVPSTMRVWRFYGRQHDGGSDIRARSMQELHVSATHEPSEPDGWSDHLDATLTSGELPR